MRIFPLALATALVLCIAMTTAASAGRGTRPIFIPLNPIGSIWAVQPNDFRVSRSLDLGYMTWRGWGRFRAVGHGITFVGRNKHGANAIVRLWGVKRCYGRRYYARVAVESENVSRVDYVVVANKYGECGWVWRSSD